MDDTRPNDSIVRPLSFFMRFGDWIKNPASRGLNVHLFAAHQRVLQRQADFRLRLQSATSVQTRLA